jgi:predicted phosphate transport protein (TIGR00153 family)
MIRLAFRLIPREEKFFSDFQALADELKVGARLLEEMLEPDHPLWKKADEIKEVEHKCDFLTHGIIQRLNRTFVTPLDREDIHALARSLDDVMDSIDASATLIRLYRLDTVRFGARELAQIITASTHQVRLALDALEQQKGILGHAVEINRLENEADRVHQQAVSQLFDAEHDPLTVMKWKESLDFLEDATDRCEDVANVLEGVMVKHG